MEVLTGLTPDSSPQRALTLEPCEVEDGLRLALDAGCNQRYLPVVPVCTRSGGPSVPLDMLILRYSIASRGVFSPAVWFGLCWVVRSRRPSSCALSCIHCFVFISRDVAFRLRGRRHEFLVARLLCCRCFVLSPIPRICRLKRLAHLNNAFVGDTEHFLITRSAFTNECHPFASCRRAWMAPGGSH